MRARILPLAVALALPAGCSVGPMFRLDPALAATRGVRLEGGETTTAVCPDEAKKGDQPRASEPPPAPTFPFAKGRHIRFGDVSAEVVEARTGTTTTALMADANLRALASVREAAGRTADATTLKLAIGQAAAETSPVGAARIARAAAQATGAVGSTLRAIDDVNTLFDLKTSSQELLSFSLEVRTKAGERTVAVSCQSSDVVHPFELSGQSDFALTCVFVPAATEPLEPWAVQVRSTGTLRSYQFSGGLARATPRTDLLFGDQHYGLLGGSSITGFEILSAPDRRQIAALQRFSLVDGKYVDQPRIYLAPEADADRAEHDVRAAMMALAALFPWPSPCSTSQKGPG